eukprot:GHVQ01022784.1.p1 GENE.GHVQ01022784.1~~GHVQ01022784.1.p1  ORF type:complete len:251 (-),score=39.11 GHVQ01022784.1:741-1493(-)
MSVVCSSIIMSSSSSCILYRKSNHRQILSWIGLLNGRHSPMLHFTAGTATTTTTDSSASPTCTNLAYQTAPNYLCNKRIVRNLMISTCADSYVKHCLLNNQITDSSRHCPLHLDISPTQPTSSPVFLHCPSSFLFGSTSPIDNVSVSSSVSTVPHLFPVYVSSDASRVCCDEDASGDDCMPWSYQNITRNSWMPSSSSNTTNAHLCCPLPPSVECSNKGPAARYPKPANKGSRRCLRMLRRVRKRLRTGR